MPATYISRLLVTRINDHSPQLATILAHLPLLTLEQKKFVLLSCRIQSSTIDNCRLRRELASVASFIRAPLSRFRAPNIVYEVSFVELMRKLTDEFDITPFDYGIISAFLRCEFITDEEYETITRETFSKELNACITPFPVPRINWDIYFGDVSRPRFSGEYYITPGSHRIVTIAPEIRAQLFGLKMKYTVRRRILYPALSGERMSEDSIANLKVSYTRDPISEKGYSSLDLHRHYYETGEQIQGRNQLKMAWRYGDLKPRAYYAYGATEHFASLYVKGILDDLLRIPDSCHVDKRYDMDRLSIESCRAYETVVYDFSSFTTCLSALYDFCVSLSIYLGDVEVDLFDFHYGFRSVTLSSLFKEYAEKCLLYSSFDVWDDVQKSFQTYRQTNGGMLGIQGNIAMSMLLHALYLQGVIDNDNCSVVGDDALCFSTHALQSDEILDMMSRIGILNKDKAAILKPWPHDLMLTFEQFHYLKRPLFYNRNGVIGHGYLPEFPLPVNAYGSNDRKRSPPGSLRERTVSFVSQYQNYLRNYACLTRYDDPGESNAMLEILRDYYHHLYLPTSGCLPGRRGGSTDHYNLLAIPPVDSIRVPLDWEDYLWLSSQETVFVMPMVVEDEYVDGDPIFGFVGQRFKMTKKPYFQSLCGIGVMKSRMCEEILDRTVASRMKFKRWASRTGSVVYEYEYVETPSLPIQNAIFDLIYTIPTMPSHG